MPSNRQAELKFTTRVPEWPQRLVMTDFNPETRILTCGFEGGFVAPVAVERIGVDPGSKILIATPDEFGSGILFALEDGTIVDCGADLVLHSAATATENDANPAVDTEDLAQRIARRLRAYRERHDLTQRVMSKRLDMAPSNYHRLEAGRHQPTAETLLRVAEAMGIPLGRLVSV